MLRLVLTLAALVSTALALSNQHVEIIRYFPHNEVCPNLLHHIKDCGSMGRIVSVRVGGCPTIPCHLNGTSFAPIYVDWKTAHAHEHVLVTVELTRNGVHLPTLSEKVDAHLLVAHYYTIMVPLVASAHDGLGTIEATLKVTGSEGVHELCGSAKIILGAK